MLIRLFEIIYSFVLLLLFTPFFVVISLLLKITKHPTIFFIQPRTGYLGSEFNLIKFCTMINLENEKGELAQDKDRLTKLGIFLRKTSLDELPSFLNILKGEMNLVGPRPLLTEYLELYDSNQIKRLDVKPGITGWAQINGRNNISWQKKFELDLWYVKNRSLRLDLYIIFRTIFKVFTFDGVNKQGHVTTEKFDGNNT